ncbi:MAG: hypothetical protein WCT46_02995 [Candidatus Gracilibacteria bacterium]|jgi:hypothetical protein
MIHELFISASNFCPSLVFNNPGKITEACFSGNEYENPLFNPCTAAVGGLLFGAIMDGASSSTGGGSDYYDSGSTTTTTGGPGETAPETNLSDFLPSEYREPTLSDVVD